MRFKKRILTWLKICTVTAVVLAYQACGNPTHLSHDDLSSLAYSSAGFRCPTNESPMGLDAKRLSKLEYTNALQSLVARALGSSEASALLALNNIPNRLPADASNAYTTGDRNFSAIHAKEFFDIADALANGLVQGTRYSRFVSTYIGYNPGTCVYSDPANLNQDCRDTLIRNFILRAFGRPVEATTANGNNEMASFQLEFQLAANTTAGVNALIFKTLMAPEFLNHLQIDVAPSEGNVYRLSSYAIARRLAFVMTQTLPDETLLSMAGSSDLLSETAFVEAVNYLGPKMDSTLQQFTTEWLKLNNMPAFAATTHPKFALVTQGFTANEALKQAMANEVTELVSYINKNNRSAGELFTTNISFARDSGLMKIYNQTVPAPAAVTEQNAVRFPAAERGGLLTRAAMLFSGSHTENPITRGVHIRDWVLCSRVPDPPPDLQNVITAPPPDGNMTTRERYHAKTTGSACIGCHSQINPVGFAFSKFNAFGAFQSVEPIYNDQNQLVNNIPTDSTVNLQVALEIDQDVPGAIEFSQAVADSNLFKQCFTRKFYAFSQNLSTLPASQNSCAMDKMYKAFKPGSTLQDFFKSAVMESRFRYRKID